MVIADGEEKNKISEYREIITLNRDNKKRIKLKSSKMTLTSLVSRATPFARGGRVW